MSKKDLRLQPLIDDAINEAKNLPDLIAEFEAIDPGLAEQLRGKALIASKTPWGTLASGIVGWLVAHYGLGFDQATTDLIAGLCVFAGSYAMRYITRGPIVGIITHD